MSDPKMPSLRNALNISPDDLRKAWEFAQSADDKDPMLFNYQQVIRCYFGVPCDMQEAEFGLGIIHNSPEGRMK
jgi:hypothetical protein